MYVDFDSRTFFMFIEKSPKLRVICIRSTNYTNPNVYIKIRCQKARKCRKQNITKSLKSPLRQLQRVPFRSRIIDLNIQSIDNLFDVIHSPPQTFMKEPIEIKLWSRNRWTL